MTDTDKQKLLGNPYGTANIVQLNKTLETLKRPELLKFCEKVGAYFTQGSSEYEMKQSIVDKFKKDPRAIDWTQAPKPHVFNIDPNCPKVQALQRAGIL